ncbi:sulfatase-like hydrolase/transferase [Paenibacillus rhizovicinus]|uniref:Sulfatase-like hydrolase/transferase n=1 Tax=Paenibacillus rhizovicinus TaxID=2704463 RepID=A0A6C0P7U9_9BACL|nr:sulfatase-like hydrolase/transferase [Paenibacillus rhizovicinus]QHW34634.1 sulfatase-like hydrolase/transferase [Paenibacillus rhizovicinus]
MNDRKPNILLITADQLRYDCIGSSGKYPVHTPHLDRLAEQSTLFSQAYSHIPVCSPARQSMLHGKRPETFGALWNYNAFLPVGCLQPSQYTWTAALAENGYKSAFLGKWGVNPEQDPTAFGFISYVSESDYAAFRKSRYPDVVYTNGFMGETNPIPLEDTETHWFAERAIETMGKLNEGGEPWHIALHFAEPHLPCRPAGRFADMYDAANVPEWDGFGETFRNKPYIQRQQLLSWGIEDYGWEDWAPIVARYYGIISQLDEAIGKVLSALERSGAAEHTVVVFTADHGDMCGSHRMMDKHYILYDDVVHVPFIVRQPGGRRAGTASSELVYNLLDLGPTLLELAGVDSGDKAQFHGKSLLPLLSGEADVASVTWRDAVVASYNGQQFGLFTQRMIRTSAWKYVWNLTDLDELYNMERDPAELDNLIGQAELEELVTGLRRRLYDQLKTDGDPAVNNEWTRRQLLTGAIVATRVQE